MMIKKLVFVMALASLVVATGCAKGGSGPCVSNCAAITLNLVSNGVVGATQTPLNAVITITATVTGATSPDVNWAITGTSCSGSGNPCGSFTATTGTTATYQAPSSIPSTPQFTITATSQSNSGLVGSAALTIVPTTTSVAPPVINVGVGLTQEFVGVAIPDNAVQSFTWSCTSGNGPCVNFTQDPNISGLVTYKPTSAEGCGTGTGCVEIDAAGTADPAGCSFDPQTYPCTPAKVTPVTSRLTGASSTSVKFGFQFSGYDSGGNHVYVAGSFIALNGSISSGVEDEIAWNGSQYAVTQHAISGGSYTPINGNDPNSNNQGTLALSLPGGVFPNQYQAVLDASGDIQMIESDGHGSGSGTAEPVASNNGFNSGSSQSFAFGFTGVDSAHNRVGYAGVIPTNGSGSISAGLMDINDNGNTTNICGAAPCNIAGSYSYNAAINSGQMTLTSATTMHFDFFLANGQSGKNNNATLSIYAISTDAVDATHPAVLGSMMFQDPAQTYNNAAFKGFSVSALTGTNANVSLTLANTDGKGNFSGQFDQNNAGTMISAASFSSYKYAQAPTTSSNGRYTIQMLGNPSASPVVNPLPFILYASGSNRGFLLDQNSSSVITGTMTPQKSPPKSIGLFTPTAIASTYAVATNSNSSSTVAPLTMNLLLTSPGNNAFNVTGVQNPGNQTVTGTYTLDSFTSLGTFVFTAPAAHYILYPISLTDFYIIQDASKDTGVSSAILFAAQ